RLDSLFLSTERSVVSSCSHRKNGLSGNPYVASRVISRGKDVSPFRAREVVFTRVCGHAARSIAGTEQLLTAEVRRLDAASYRRRAEIEEELAEIHHLLEALGLRERNSN